MFVFSTLDAVQSPDAVESKLLHAEVVLLPRAIVNGFDVRAQWYLPQEWFAEADPASAVAVISVIAARATSFFKSSPFAEPSKQRTVSILVAPPECPCFGHLSRRRRKRSSSSGSDLLQEVEHVEVVSALLQLSILVVEDEGAGRLLSLP